MTAEFHAYYYSLKATGNPHVDAILKEVARAGKAFHNTDQWYEADYDGKSPIDKIQAAADAAAAAFEGAGR